ncbi:putative invasin [Escherichia coli]|nr:putative invasin [Escherichia coli]
MRVAARLCLLTQVLFPVLAGAGPVVKKSPESQGLTPGVTGESRNTPSSFLPDPSLPGAVRTVPYLLGPLESAQSVADRFGLTLEELRRLNQLRTFARGFDHIRQGDEIDVPYTPSRVLADDGARELMALQTARGGQEQDPEARVAGMASQAGSLLKQGVTGRQAADMARGYAAGAASGAATDWLGQYGTARVTLGVDENFSLKNSALDFLHPWYETQDNLFFTQHSLHRTDERTQMNHGVGWRHFTDTDMKGVNLFVDHDLTRYHTRLGVGGVNTGGIT